MRVELAEDSTEIQQVLYLELIKKALLDLLHNEPEYDVIHPESMAQRLLAHFCAARDIHLMRRREADPVLRADGRDWPARAQTMTGLKRLNNVQYCIERILSDRIPGDFIETGVWRGGCTIFMRCVLKAKGITDRTVWVADSFQGLPKPDPERFPADQGDDHWRWKQLAVDIDQVKNNFARYGLLDEQVQFLVGWFRDTLPNAPIRNLALIRLDGDMYESTMDGLSNLYPKLSPGGFVIIDDYGCIDSCRQAVHEYRERNGIGEEIHRIDWTGAYWRRSQFV